MVAYKMNKVFNNKMVVKWESKNKTLNSKSLTKLLTKLELKIQTNSSL